MRRAFDDRAISIRIIGAIGIGVGVCAMIAGIAGVLAGNSRRDLGAFALLGAYLVATGIATAALNRIGAALLVVPLALAGVTAVIATSVTGPVVAVILNLLVTMPLLCGPAVLVWRNRRALR